MFYLLCTVLCSVLNSLILRMSNSKVKNELAMFASNYVVCILLSYLYLDKSLSFVFELDVLILAMIIGCLFLVSFFFFKVNIKYNGMVLSSTFMKLGIIIPTLMAIFVFKEEPKINQIIGILISIFAIILINYEKDAMNQGSKKWWLVLLLIINGFSDSGVNIFRNISTSSNDIFMIMIFVFALILTSIFMMKDKQKVYKEDIFYGVILAIPNYYSVRFMMAALESIDAILVYPIYSVGTIIFVTLIGVLFFKEKLSKNKTIALGLILISLVLLNI